MADSPTLVLDVAVLGQTNVQNDTHALNLVQGPDFHESDFRGGIYYFEGAIFPGGTFPEDKSRFDLDAHQAIGSYFNHGVPILHPGRRQPHLLSTQTFILGLLGDADPSPDDQLISHGVEHGNSPEISFTRAVIGGTGRYNGARGYLVEEAWGENTSVLANYGPPDFAPQAPNHRYSFYLLD